MVSRSNQLWETDVIYGDIAGEDQFSTSQPSSMCASGKLLLTTSAYRAGPSTTRGPCPKPGTGGGPNGPKFTAHTFEARCEELGVDHERIPAATPQIHAVMERWDAPLNRECLAQEFTTFAEAYHAVSPWIQDYNERRLHGSPKFWSPLAMAARGAAGLDHWTPARM